MLPLRFDLIDAPPAPVITSRHPDLAGNKYGFEGGCFVKEAGAYHAFMAEIAGDPFNCRMRLAHWSSPDLQSWQRLSTLHETDGSITPGDQRFSLRARQAFDEKRGRSSMIMVSHDVGTVKTYCDRGLVLHRGKLLAFGDIDDAVEFYRKAH